jgi:methylated-DNA-[protein]-cysteine S-methyltransferase
MMDSNMRHAIVTTAIGDVTLVAAGDALVGLYFAKHWYKPAAATFGKRVQASAEELLAAAERQLAEYLHGHRTAFDLPLATHGDLFQERIWSLLREIPYGQTATYGDLAQRYGNRSLAHDVGQAVGRNPLSIIVPCHRVVGKGGKLVGYAGGLARKKALLEIEGQLCHAGSVRTDIRYLTLEGLGIPSPIVSGT